jgi:hypothetical protein
MDNGIERQERNSQRNSEAIDVARHAMGDGIDNANSDEATPNDDETHSSKPTVG